MFILFILSGHQQYQKQGFQSKKSCVSRAPTGSRPRKLMNFCVPFQVTAETDQPRVSTPNSQVTSSSPGVGAALAALGGLGGIFGNHLQMLGSLQAFQNPQSLQQLQQLAMLQQASGNQINPQTQFFLQNQVSTSACRFSLGGGFRGKNNTGPIFKRQRQALGA